MATSSFATGTNHGLNWAHVDVAASQTDSTVVAAVTGKRIRVVAFSVSCGGTASTVVFQTNSTAISPIFNNSIVHPRNTPNRGEVCPGWFETASGEALKVSTGAGSTTGILVLYDTIG